jgi:hypothetical protein
MADISDRLLHAISHKSPVDLDEVREYLLKARQKNLADLGKQVTTIKSFLSNMGLPASATKELDELCMDIQDRWTVTVEAIEGMLTVD